MEVGNQILVAFAIVLGVTLDALALSSGIP